MVYSYLFLFNFKLEINTVSYIYSSFIWNSAKYLLDVFFFIFLNDLSLPNLSLKLVAHFLVSLFYCPKLLLSPTNKPEVEQVFT